MRPNWSDCESASCLSLSAAQHIVRRSCIIGHGRIFWEPLSVRVSFQQAASIWNIASGLMQYRVRRCSAEFCCNGTVVESPELGQVIQLQGDQRKNVSGFLVTNKLAKKVTLAWTCLPGSAYLTLLLPVLWPLNSPRRCPPWVYLCPSCGQ